MIIEAGGREATAEEMLVQKIHHQKNQLLLKPVDARHPRMKCNYTRHQRNSMIIEATGREASAEEMYIRFNNAI